MTIYRIIIAAGQLSSYCNFASYSDQQNCYQYQTKSVGTIKLPIFLNVSNKDDWKLTANNLCSSCPLVFTL